MALAQVSGEALPPGSSPGATQHSWHLRRASTRLVESPEMDVLQQLQAEHAAANAGRGRCLRIFSCSWSLSLSLSAALALLCTVQVSSVSLALWALPLLRVCPARVVLGVSAGSALGSLVLSLPSLHSSICKRVRRGRRAEV